MLEHWHYRSCQRRQSSRKSRRSKSDKGKTASWIWVLWAQGRNWEKIVKEEFAILAWKICMHKTWIHWTCHKGLISLGHISKSTSESTPCIPSCFSPNAPLWYYICYLWRSLHTLQRYFPLWMFQWDSVIYCPTMMHQLLSLSLALLCARADGGAVYEDQYEGLQPAMRRQMEATYRHMDTIAIRCMMFSFYIQHVSFGTWTCHFAEFFIRFWTVISSWNKYAGIYIYIR